MFVVMLQAMICTAWYVCCYVTGNNLYVVCLLLRYRQYSVGHKKFVATLQAIFCTSYVCCFVTDTTQKLTTTTWTDPETEEPVMYIHFVHRVQLHKPYAVVAVVHDDTPKLYAAVAQGTQLYTAVYTAHSVFFF